MQRIAFITYLFGEKSNSMSGLRTLSWAKALADAGMEVTVFTRDWKEVKDIQAIEHVESAGYADRREEWLENIRIVYLPYTKPYEPSLPLLQKIRNAFLAAAGHYSGEADITPWYAALAEEHIKKPFTHFITSCHPFSSLILMQRIKKRLGTCITLVDFRDYINVNLLNPEIRFSFFSRMVISIQQRWITRYVKKIDLVTTASESISEMFEKVHRCKNVTTVYNGFEAGLFESIEETAEHNIFNVSLTGTLYPHQDIDFMLRGLIGFFEKNSGADDIRINFIGVDYYGAVASHIRNELTGYSRYINITPRIQRSKALSVMKGSSVLFYVGWKGWKGIYSGKIFEYLGAKKNILIAPNDGDVLEKLVHYTNSGRLADTAEDMALILDNWYRQWKKNELKYNGIEERINEFTREAQSVKILNLLRKQ